MEGFSKIYQEALEKSGNLRKEPSSNLDDSKEQKRIEDEQREQQEQFEVMFLNWRISPVTKDLEGKIESRISELNNANLNLAFSTAPVRFEQISRNLVEICTLKKVLGYIGSRELELT